MAFEIDRFPLRTIRKHGGGFLPVLDIKCSCGATDQVSLASGKRLPPQAAAKKFAERGWVVGRLPKDDTCPACAAAELARRKAARASHARAEPSAPLVHEDATMTTTAPRIMQRADRRRVLDEIEAHYPEPERGYRNGISDEVIAAKLNVPRAWVTAVREEIFGPAIVIDWKSVDRRQDEINADFKRISDAMVEHISSLERKVSDLNADIAKLKAAK